VPYRGIGRSGDHGRTRNLAKPMLLPDNLSCSDHWSKDEHCITQKDISPVRLVLEDS